MISPAPNLLETTPTCRSCGSPLDEVACSVCAGLGADWVLDPVAGDRVNADACAECRGDGYFWLCPLCPNAQPSWVLGTYTLGEAMGGQE